MEFERGGVLVIGQEILGDVGQTDITWFPAEKAESDGFLITEHF